MERYDGEMSRAESNIRSANIAVSQVGVISFTCSFIVIGNKACRTKHLTIATKRFAIEVCFSFVYSPFYVK